MPTSDVNQLIQRIQITVHRKNRIYHNQPSPEPPGIRLQSAPKLSGIHVGHHTQLGTRQPARVDQ
jgi:hypothetical protein